jgi:hypothetical protein
MGLPDYVLFFRKWAHTDAELALVRPVTEDPSRRARFSQYVGMNPPDEKTVRAKLKPGDTFERAYSIEVWQRYASPVWDDISQTRVLNIKHSRSKGDERHICPLQRDVIERCIHLYSNPGDLVMSPFAGIGSEGYGALELGRKFVGFELKDSYFNCAVRHLKELESVKADIPDMFAESGDDDSGEALVKRSATKTKIKRNAAKTTTTI